MTLGVYAYSDADAQQDAASRLDDVLAGTR